MERQTLITSYVIWYIASHIWQAGISLCDGGALAVHLIPLGVITNDKDMRAHNYEVNALICLLATEHVVLGPSKKKQVSIQPC